MDGYIYANPSTGTEACWASSLWTLVDKGDVVVGAMATDQKD